VAEARLFSSSLTRPPKVGGLLLSSSGALALALVLMVQKKARQLRRALEVRTCFDAKRSPNIVCPRHNLTLIPKDYGLGLTITALLIRSIPLLIALGADLVRRAWAARKAQ
jgi:hypothetical protein